MRCLFCSKKEANDDWLELIKELDECESSARDLHRIERGGREACQNFEEIDEDNVPTETKLLTRGILPAGTIEGMEKGKDADEMKTMKML